MSTAAAVDLIVNILKHSWQIPTIYRIKLSLARKSLILWIL